MKRWYWLIGCAALALGWGIFHSQKNASMDLSSYQGQQQANPVLAEVLNQDAQVRGGKVRFLPTFTSEQELLDLWHLAEGSEVFPMLWFYKMKSQTSRFPQSGLHERLDEKFGILKVPERYKKVSKYPANYIGLTAGYSDSDPRDMDVKVNSPQEFKQIVRSAKDGSKVAMIGVNCAFCHTNQMSVQNSQAGVQTVEGAPAMLYIRGFFQDLFASALVTMLDPELLTQFVQETRGLANSRQIAEEFVHNFKTELGLNQGKAGFKALVAERALTRGVLVNTFLSAKKTTIKKVAFEKQAVVAKYFGELLKLSYKLDSLTPELQHRMMYLAKSAGADPSLALTPEGFSRTDAFGRISNLVARFHEPMPLTATASLPPMWGLKYKSLFHWNANTNSVVSRNVGQSFGLGAILTNPPQAGQREVTLENYRTTTNLHNLYKIEELLYKLQFPKWETFEPKTLSEAEVQSAVRGCDIYYNQRSCAGCHEAQHERVGPTKELVHHLVFPTNQIGTDDVYLRNQATPINTGEKQIAFRKGLFNFTGQVKNWYYKTHNVSATEQRAWEKTDLRGHEDFRDTSLGHNEIKPGSDYMQVPADPQHGYVARPLAAAWATAPYLHNGSVSSMAELLKPAAQRKKIFFVGSRTLNPNTLGYLDTRESIPFYDAARVQAAAEKVLKMNSDQVAEAFGLPKKAGVDYRAKDNNEAMDLATCKIYPESCLDTRLLGNGNRGHEGELFGTGLSDNQKKDLIEFLKHLRPEVEFSRPQKQVVYRFTGSRCEAVR